MVPPVLFVPKTEQLILSKLKIILKYNLLKILLFVNTEDRENTMSIILSKSSVIFGHFNFSLGLCRFIQPPPLHAPVLVPVN